MGIKINDLGVAGPLTDTDNFAVAQASVTNKANWGDMKNALIAVAAAVAVDPSLYNTNPVLAPDRIDFTPGGAGSTDGIKVGMAVSLVQNAITKYYLVTAIDPSTSITVSGPAIAGGQNITDLKIITPGRATQMGLLLPGNYLIGDETTTLYNRETRSQIRWQGPPSYLTHMAARHNTPDTGTQPVINVSVQGTNIFTGGLTLPANGDWAQVADGSADGTEYMLEYGEIIEIDLTTTGGNGDARDLSVNLNIVTP